MTSTTIRELLSGEKNGYVIPCWYELDDGRVIISNSGFHQMGIGIWVFARDRDSWPNAYYKNLYEHGLLNVEIFPSKEEFKKAIIEGLNCFSDIVLTLYTKQSRVCRQGVLQQLVGYENGEMIDIGGSTWILNTNVSFRTHKVIQKVIPGTTNIL